MVFKKHWQLETSENFCLGCDRFFLKNKEVVAQPSSKTSLQCSFCPFTTGTVKPSKARQKLERHYVSLHDSVHPVVEEAATEQEHEDNRPLAKSHTGFDQESTTDKEDDNSCTQEESDRTVKEALTDANCVTQEKSDSSDRGCSMKGKQ